MPARVPSAPPDSARGPVGRFAPEVAASADAPETPAPVAVSHGPSLFERIGGEAGVATLVDRFVLTIATDHRVSSNPLVKRRMKKVSVPVLRQHFVDQLVELTGGPKRYRGRDMRASHEGLQISGAEWDAGLEDLVAAMNVCGFGEREKAEILDLIRPMRSQIVELP
jgi:hemoglobin